MDQTVSFAKSSAAHPAPDLAAWLSSQLALNGLASQDLKPWHILIHFDQFDEDGDKVHSGTIEERWAGPKKNTIAYKTDALNQTDYATPGGLFRAGDQRWPNRAELAARSEIVDPFAYAATLQGFRTLPLQRAFGPNTLDCMSLQRASGGMSSPTQYCFEPAHHALRYVRGSGWNQIACNNLVDFQGRTVAREVTVTNSGKPYLDLHVSTLELLPEAAAQDFTPPPGAVNLSGTTLTGVSPVLLQQQLPQYPDSLRQQSFSVTVEVVIGRNGHVTSAHAIAGKPEAYKAAEAAVRKWTFQPYLVLGEPAEVQSKVVLNNN